MKWLQDAANSVKRNAFYMKRALVSTRVAAACACAPYCASFVTVQSRILRIEPTLLTLDVLLLPG